MLNKGSGLENTLEEEGLKDIDENFKLIVTILLNYKIVSKTVHTPPNPLINWAHILPRGI